MATSTWNDMNEGSSNNNPAKIIVPVVLFLAVISGFVWYFMSLQTVNTTLAEDYVIEDYVDLTPAQIRIIEIVSGHAFLKHSASEVNGAFECIGKYGTSKAFKTFGFKGSKGEFIPTNLWMCFNKETGDWYTVITTVFEKVGQNKVARLVTAYKISDLIFPNIESYIEHITNKWGAVILNYAINAERIYLQFFK